MSAALNSCDADLRKYLLDHHLPDLFESLLCALAVNQPVDGKQFIVEKVLEVQNNPSMLEKLQWDTFIDADKKPKIRVGSFNLLWAREDDQPSDEMLMKAYSFYNHKLLKLCFGGLCSYYRAKKQKHCELGKRFQALKAYYRKTMCRKYFNKWQDWKQSELNRQNEFVAALTDIFDTCLERFMFRMWHEQAIDGKKTREHFEKIERGESFDWGMNGLRQDIKKDHISLLPEKVAIRVFLFVGLTDLVRCSKVCRTWKEITQAMLLWSRIDLANSEKGLISSRAVTILIQKCRPFLCHLNVRGCDFILPRTLKTIGDCKNLQDLNLSQCKGVSDDIIKEISTGCVSLLFLNISTTDVCDGSLRYISRNCHSLQYLNIAFTHNITNRGLHYLASGSQRLIYLDMSGCDQITKEGYKMLSKGLVGLSTIVLNELPSLTDNCIEALMMDCKNLRSICILHSPLLSDASIKSIVSGKKLQYLKLEGNHRLSDTSIRTAVMNSTDLRFLYFVDVQRTTDLSLKALGRCRNLTAVNVADCVRISDIGVRYLVEGLSGEKIREINFTNCIRVSDVSLLRISQKCQSLTYANFSYCEHISDAGVELLANISTLISLDLSGCKISDPGVISLSHNPNFRDINISECCGVTDVGIQKFAANAQYLESLNVSHLNQLTDQSMKSLSFFSRRLRVLNLSGCHLISDQGLQYLTAVCQFLEKLDISGCKEITDRSLRYLRKGCPNIKILTMLYCRGISKYSATKMQNKIRGKVLHSQDNTIVYLGNRIS